ncbi:MAG: PTS sugar transporter subunit IIA [Verrucomicrobiota bacterium JB023]|nr:PTS sugar transporter subunit IIA [Verrucomicrobiota bacterium JB023]
MKLANLLHEDQVVLKLHSRTCGEVMEELVDLLARQGKLHNGMRDRALKALQNRESQISTGIGCGVGLPHAYVEGLNEVLAVFGKSKAGLEFDSCDHAPVHFVVMLLIPEEEKTQHLLTLADIGKRFLSCETRKGLAAAGTPSEVISILSR